VIGGTVRLPSGAYPIRWIAPLLLATLAVAGCSGGEATKRSFSAPNNASQSTTASDQLKRPVHSLGPEMRRVKAPPKRLAK
jgi:hypothetical protein